VEEEQRGEWNHPIIPLTEENRQRREALQNTILSESSIKAYSSLLVRFVTYVADTHPQHLTNQMQSDLRLKDHSEWSKIIRDHYINSGQKPCSTMVKIPMIPSMFCEWVSAMKSNKNAPMSSSTYNSCRSAVFSLYTYFRKPSQEFDEEASQILRALQIEHSMAAHTGVIRPQKGKLPFSFENYCDVAKKKKR